MLQLEDAPAYPVWSCRPLQQIEPKQIPCLRICLVGANLPQAIHATLPKGVSTLPSVKTWTLRIAFRRRSKPILSQWVGSVWTGQHLLPKVV